MSITIALNYDNEIPNLDFLNYLLDNFVITKKMDDSHYISLNDLVKDRELMNYFEKRLSKKDKEINKLKFEIQEKTK